MPLTVALPRERRERERRVALVPAAVQRLLERPGVAVRIESGCGRSAGFRDETYEGVDVAADFAATVDGADIVCKVGVPTLAEIERLAPGTVLVSLTRAFLHLPEIAALADGGVTTVAMDLVPRTARARAMDALSSQATVAGYKAALLAAELSPRLFPMMTTAAGTIRPSRVVVIGAGVAGLQAIATARRLGAEVEAYDIRSRARERIESLGARMIDTGVDGTDAHGRARALRRDEQRHQHDVLAERLARAHAVICAAAIPDRPAPRIVTRDMVEGMLPDTVIVDMAAATGGNCELTRAGEDVQFGDTLIVGPLNLPSHGAVHASEMYARNVVNMLSLVIGTDGTLALDADDDILARVVLTHAGHVCDGATAAAMERPVHPFGGTSEPVVDEDVDGEADWVSEMPVTPEAVRAGSDATADRTVASEASERGPDKVSSGVSSSSAVRGATRAEGVPSPDEASAREKKSDDRTAGVAKRATPAEPTRAGKERPPDDSDGSFGAAEASSRSSVTPSPSVASPTATDVGASDETGDADPPPDDLTAIDGVGPALQERLYAFGVTRLETLAGLDEPGRRRLAVQLELDEEIEEGDWAGQARALLAQRERERGAD